MFKEQTLLILGAGASIDYGFPLGKDLIDRILNDKEYILSRYEEEILKELEDVCIKANLEMNFDIIEHLCFGYERNTNDEERQNFLSMLNRAPFKKDDFNCEFNSLHFREIHNSIRKETIYLDYYNKYILAVLFFQKLEEFDPTSIDFFLSLHTEFQYKDEKGNSTNIGKYAIAYEIVKCREEFDNRLKGYIRDENGKKERFSSWYRYLLNEILLGCQNNQQHEILKNNLSIITFNYDTSLELFLDKRLRNMNYFKEEGQNLVFLERLKRSLFHVYGKIDFADQSKSLIELSEGIKVIGEERNSKESFEKIIIDAKKVFILGYAFDEANNEKISMKSVFALNENAMRAENGRLWLDKEVVVLNYNNSRIINSSIKKMIFDNANDTSFEPSANPPDESGYCHSPTPEMIDLSNVENLTIITNSIVDAIGNDFNFSN